MSLFEWLASVWKYDPNQPRVPAGSPQGGQWTRGQGDILPPTFGILGVEDADTFATLFERWDDPGQLYVQEMSDTRLTPDMRVFTEVTRDMLQGMQVERHFAYHTEPRTADEQWAREQFLGLIGRFPPGVQAALREAQFGFLDSRQFSESPEAPAFFGQQTGFDVDGRGHIVLDMRAFALQPDPLDPAKAIPMNLPRDEWEHTVRSTLLHEMVHFGDMVAGRRLFESELIAQGALNAKITLREFRARLGGMASYRHTGFKAKLQRALQQDVANDHDGLIKTFFRATLDSPTEAMADLGAFLLGARVLRRTHAGYFRRAFPTAIKVVEEALTVGEIAAITGPWTLRRKGPSYTTRVSPPTRRDPQGDLFKASILAGTLEWDAQGLAFRGIEGGFVVDGHFFRPAVEIMKYDPNQPRDERGRWVASGALGSRLLRLAQEQGGFTFDLRHYRERELGFVVGVAPQSSLAKPINEVTLLDVQTWLDTHRTVLRKPGMAVGGWLEQESGKLWLDVVKVYDSKPAALRAARTHNQIAIAHLQRGRGRVEIIETGGTGLAKAGGGPAHFVLFDPDVSAETILRALGRVAKYDPNQPRDERGRWTSVNFTQAGVVHGPLHDTPEWKAWFGASKVVNPDGSPKVVFHGTRHQFSQFSFDDFGQSSTTFDRALGPHFTAEPDVAAQFAAGVYATRIDLRGPGDGGLYGRDWVRNRDGIGQGPIPVHGGGRLIPAYLRIERPMTVPTYAYEDLLKDYAEDDWESPQHLGDEESVALFVMTTALKASPKLFGDWLRRSFENDWTRAEATARARELLAQLDTTGEMVLGTKQGRPDPTLTFSSMEQLIYSTGLDRTGVGPSAGGSAPSLKWRIFSTFRQVAQEAGYDGLIYQNTSSNEVLLEGDNRVWIPFSPSQIKSIWNATPDPKSPKIHKYDPSQPRVPAGSSDGGQWTARGAQIVGDVSSVAEALDYLYSGLLEVTSPEDIRAVFAHLKVRPLAETVKRWNREQVLSEPLLHSLYRAEDGTLVEWDGTGTTVWVHGDPATWLNEQDMEAFDQDYEERENRKFWRDTPPVYHATPPENVAVIEAEGLLAMHRSRGLANRHISAAVFTSEEVEGTASYGDAVFEIDTAAMKRDGYTPFVYREPDVVEAEKRRSLAYLLDLHEYDPPAEENDPRTWIFDGSIPAKYLRRVVTKYDPDQPRIPAGQPGGGRWTDGLGGLRAQSIPDRKATFEMLSVEEQDRLGDATRSIRQRIAAHLDGVEAWVDGDYRARIASAVRAGVVHHEAGSKIEYFAEQVEATLAGAPAEVRTALVREVTDHVLAQEAESSERSLGDHGVRHLLQDAEIALQILKVVPGIEESDPAVRASVWLAAAFHDAGYLTPPSRIFLDDPHPRWSVQHYEAHLKPLVTAALGAKQAEGITHLIATHADTTIHWEGPDVVGSAFRLSDNLALFHAEKLPAMIRYAPKNLSVLSRLAAKEITEQDARAEIAKNLRAAPGMTSAYRAKLLRAAEEVTTILPKLSLGMLHGNVQGFMWTGQHLRVRLRKTPPATALLRRTADLGMRQFQKLGQTYGLTTDKALSEAFAKRRIGFSDRNGKLLVEFEIDDNVTKYDPDQPRIPAGQPGGGRWTDDDILALEAINRGDATVEFTIDNDEITKIALGTKRNGQTLDARVRARGWDFAVHDEESQRIVDEPYVNFDLTREGAYTLGLLGHEMMDTLEELADHGYPVPQTIHLSFATANRDNTLRGWFVPKQQRHLRATLVVHVPREPLNAGLTPEEIEAVLRDEHATGDAFARGKTSWASSLREVLLHEFGHWVHSKELEKRPLSLTTHSKIASAEDLFREFPTYHDYEDLSFPPLWVSAMRTGHPSVMKPWAVRPDGTKASGEETWWSFRDDVSRHLSGYATEHPAEFVAEVFSRHHAGYPVPKHLVRLYDALHGAPLGEPLTSTPRT